VLELKSLLASGLAPLWIEGEISNYTRSAAGHRYFSLKDDTNQLKCALFKGRAPALKFEPADGLKVIAFGRVDLFGPRSEVQLQVEQLLPAGEGLLELALRELRERLRQEGLFDSARKRPLPRFPRRIGIVTSARGAALRDILHVLARRAPHVQVVIADTLVQGPAAAAGIALAIAAFNRAANVDVLIVARGGGSLEDLWAFNEEAVVRAVAASGIPVISGVGHETDITLTDLAADLRAATPSAAAELAVRSRADWREQTEAVFARLRQNVMRRCETAGERLQGATTRYGFKRPEEALRTFAQIVDGLLERLFRAAPARARDAWAAYRALATRPVLGSPRQGLERARARLAEVEWSLKSVHVPLLSGGRERLARSSGSLTALSPRAVLDRGYAVLLDPAGHIVSSVDQTAAHSELSAVLKDGRITTRILSREHDVSWP